MAYMKSRKSSRKATRKSNRKMNRKGSRVSKKSRKVSRKMNRKSRKMNRKNTRRFFGGFMGMDLEDFASRGIGQRGPQGQAAQAPPGGVNRAVLMNADSTSGSSALENTKNTNSALNASPSSRP
jgi:hypothetical protein